jgi:MFS transporter, FHS family, glucose/mannose:H+ symporter
MLISLGPLLDPILRDLRIPLAKAGLLSMGFAFGRVLGVILLNFALARISLKALMVGAAWVAAAGLAVSGFLAAGLWPLFIALVVTGVPVVLPNAISGIWVGAHLRQGTERGMLMVTGFFAVGVVIAPLVIGAALNLGATWRWVFLGEAGFSAVMALLLMLAPLADVPDRENLRVRQLREVAGHDPRLLAVMLTATFLYVATETTVSVWLPKFQVDTFGAGPASAALSVTLLWIGITLGRYIAVPLSRRILPSKLLAAFAAAFGLFGVGVVFSPGLLVSEILCFFAGLGASACFPLIACYTNRFPSWYAGVAFSGMMLVGTTASTVFPYLVGPIGEALGLRIAIGLSAIPALMVVILAFFLHRASKEGEPGS